MTVPDPSLTPPDFDSLGPDVGLGDQTARMLLMALRLAGGITEQQQEDAVEQLVWWRNHPVGG